MGAMQSAYTRMEDAIEKGVEAVKKKRDEAIDKGVMVALDKVLDVAGKSFTESMVPPYMPGRLEEHVRNISDRLWSAIRADTERGLKLRILRSGPHGEFREMRVRFWADTYPSGCGYRALRARFLHALLPADGNLWSMLRDPFSVLLLLLCLNPLWGSSIIISCVKFLLIDKSDEFQLVHFILQFKTFQFFGSGVLVAVQLGFAMGTSLIASDCLGLPRIASDCLGLPRIASDCL